MANHLSAKKTLRQIKKRTAINKSRTTRIRTYLKKVLLAIKGASNEEAQLAFVKAQSEVFKGVTRGVVAKRTAARTVSKLAAKLKHKVLGTEV